MALELYQSGNYDAMYLAGLIAEDSKMTRTDLNRWVQKAQGGALAGSTVAWVAAGSPYGWELALKWIDSPQAHIAEAGWATLESLVALTPDPNLDLETLKSLIQRVKQTIHEAPHPVRYAMNNYLIAVGSYVKPLSRFALQIAEAIGPVEADLGPNRCQIPFAPHYIRKVEESGKMGVKRQQVKC